MSEQHTAENRYFGHYLRRIREDRKLSLDAVEEMTVGYPEPVTKSHLSRIENGRAVPTFPRMFALCQVYGVPISSMAERFETDLRRDGKSHEAFDPSSKAFLDRLQDHRTEGRYDLVLRLTTTAIDDLSQLADQTSVELRRKFSIWQVSAMIKLEHYESCKVRCEQLISELPKTSEFHLRALVSFVVCAFRLDRCAVAVMGLDQVERLLREGEWPADLMAIAHATHGAVYYSIGDLDQARKGFENSLRCYDEIGDEFESCRARLNLAQIHIDRNQLRAANQYLADAAKEATDKGFKGLLALSFSHLALLHYRREQFDVAERYALQSNTVARQVGQRSTVFRNCYYLWKLADLRGDRASAASHEHNLKTLVNRVPQDMPEVERYRHERGDR
jgi:transcriptional regulator with XRE-family HTH domain/predicted negative regulator of RcsB-dependent stress response